MKMNIEKFKELADKYLIALETPKDAFGCTKLKIYGIENLYKALNETNQRD